MVVSLAPVLPITIMKGRSIMMFISMIKFRTILRVIRIRHPHFVFFLSSTKSNLKLKQIACYKIENYIEGPVVIYSGPSTTEVVFIHD